MARARAWYEDKIGLKPDSVEDYGAVYSLPGGTPMFLYETPLAGTAQHTLLSIDTNGLDADMAALRSKNVGVLAAVQGRRPK